MKALRVLTGLHAGAQMSLTAGSYRISSAEDADICISDWRVEAVMLVLHDDGTTRLCSENGDEVLLADFVAVPYGDVVFCIGPDEGDWPRDLELLAGLWQTASLTKQDDDTAAAGEAAELTDDAPGSMPAATWHDDGSRNAADTRDADTQETTDESQAANAASTATRRLSWRTAAIALTCSAAVVGLGTTGIMLTGAQSSEAANVQVSSDVLAKELAAALHRAGLANLTVEVRDGTLAVDGIVTTSEDNAKAHHIIDVLASGKAKRDYDVAEQDIDDIQESLADTGAHVSYSGAGVFRVSGTVHEMGAFRERIASVRGDLDRNVKRIDVDVKETRTLAPDVEYTEVVATGGLRYIETPDGTKHLFDSNPTKDHGND